MKNIDFENILLNKYYEVCRRFMNKCKEQPNKSPKDIPGAENALKEIDLYKLFVKYYFNYEYDEASHCFKEVEE